SPGSQQGIRSSFTGESWFASYVLSRSGASPIELHRPVERRTGEPRQGDNYNSSSSPLSGGVTSLDIPQHLTMRLIDAYFSLFHVFCPILDQARFLASVRDGSVSVTLLRCVLFVASIHCPLELICQMGYTSRLDAESDLFNKACASFDSEQECSRTTMILSSNLLQYWSGNATKYRDTLWWLGNSIRSAQCMGFHRSTENSKMPERTKIHWKRVWWCVYIRDRQVSLSTGPPMVISDIDFDVEDLTMDDFPDETLETARYIIAQVSLNKAASNMKTSFRAADNMSDLVDDSLLALSPERFPMIYISAIFTAMTAYVADYDTSSSIQSVQLSRRLRPNILALRQLEQCYTIARWVRNLFMEIMYRHQ
ncbi:fungal-specific transcription factor domain-containing protein, partial [Ilyonectria sp. MPI-CAGE-AT-0026]